MVCGLPITFTEEQTANQNVLDVILQSCPSEEVIQFDSDWVNLSSEWQALLLEQSIYPIQYLEVMECSINSYGVDRLAR